jgi:hypothetical protein
MPIVDGDARRKRWVPPARPEWVEKVNAEGRHLDLESVVPLDERSLLETAKRNTGLDDFGTGEWDNWHEPFTVLLESLRTESRLNLMGRLLTRTDVLAALEARLRIEDTYKRHPEIDEEQVTAPLFIVGQGRTGTSVLQHLLAEDPDSGTVRNWEAYFPCPPPEAATYRTDPRIARTDGIVTMWNRITPEIEAIHEFTGWAPTESIHPQTISFRSPAWSDSFWGQMPSFAGYIAGQDYAEAYRYEKRVLKLLQWRNPRKRWVLKSPFALSHLPKVLEVFPDAGFIWTHRDPIRAVASVISLIGTLHWIRTDHPLSGNTLEILTNSELAAGLMSQPIGWLEDGTIPRASLCNVQYRDFVRDPMGVVGQIYDWFGLELTPGADAAMRRYMDEHPRTGRPSHDYDLGSSEEIEMEREAFKTYQEYFDVPDEIR